MWIYGKYEKNPKATWTRICSRIDSSMKGISKENIERKNMKSTQNLRDTMSQ